MGTLKSIQYLRAVAAIAIIVAHSSLNLGVMQAGVDVFFVISGFLMWTVTQSTVGVFQFLWQRLARIAPLYWIATVLMAAHQQASMGALASSVAFWPFFGEGGHVWPVLVAGWTLNYEVAFYGLIGIVLPLPRRAGLIVITVVISLCGLAHPFVDPTNAALLTYTDPIIFEFLAGVALAELRLRTRLPRPGLGALLCCLGAALLSCFPGLPEAPRALVWGLPCLLIVTGALAIEGGGRLPDLNWLTLLGNASYAIYLTQALVLRTLLRAFASYPAAVKLVAVAAVTTALGVAVHWFLEKPLTRRARSFGRWLVSTVSGRRAA